MYKENYKITFQEAKQMEEYNFYNESKLSLNKLQQIIKNNNGKEIDLQGALVLTFGNIDIELNILSVDEKKYDIGYYFCAKFDPTHFNTKNIISNWDSIDYASKEFEIKDLDNIEEVMFNTMIEFARDNNYYWSKLND